MLVRVLLSDTLLKRSICKVQEATCPQLHREQGGNDSVGHIVGVAVPVLEKRPCNFSLRELISICTSSEHLDSVLVLTMVAAKKA
jgi:hypothetical protein